MKNRNTLPSLILYANRDHLSYHRTIEKLFDEIHIPYKICWDLEIQMQKGIFRIPTVELPTGELLITKEILEQLDDLKKLYNLD